MCFVQEADPLDVGLVTDEPEELSCRIQDETKKRSLTASGLPILRLAGVKVRVRESERPLGQTI